MFSLINPSIISNNDKWRDRIPVITLILAALAVRFFILLRTKASFLGNNYLGDMIFYIDMARSFSTGEIVQALRLTSQPLYPLLISLTSILTQDHELSARLISIISGSLLIYPVFKLAGIVYGKYTAIITGVFLIFAELLVFFSLMGYSESLYLFLISMAVYKAVKAFHINSKKEILFSGLFFGLSFLAKGQAVIFFFVTLTAIVIIQIMKQRKVSVNLLLWVFLFLISYGAVVSPYVILLHEKTGQWTLNPKKDATYNFIVKDDEMGKYFIIEGAEGYYTLADILWHEKKVGDATNIIPENMKDSSLKIGRYFQVLKDYLLNGLPGVLNNLFPFASICFLFAFVKLSWKPYQEGYLLSIVGANILAASLYWLNPRFISTLVPVVLIISSHGVVKAGTLFNSLVLRLSFVRNKGWLIYKWSGFIAAIVIMILFGDLYYLAQMKHDQNLLKRLEHQKQVAAELKDKYGSNFRIMSWGKGRSPIPYYMGMKQSQVRTIPIASMSMIMKYAKQEDVKLLVFETQDYVSGRHRFPGLAELMSKKGHWPGLELVMFRPVVGEESDSAVLVFRLL